MLTVALRIFWRADIPGTFSAILPVFHALRKFLPSRDYVLSTIVVLGMWPLRVAAGLHGSQAPSTFAQPRQFYESGMSLIRQGKPQQAAKLFRQGLNQDPSSLMLLNALGAAYVLEGRGEDARRYFLQALKVDPAFTPARKNLALNYFNTGQYDLAATEFERLTERPEARAAAHLFLGLIAEKGQQFDKAADLLEKSGPLLDEQPRAVVALAHSLYELRRPDQARDALQRLNSLPKVSAEVYFEAGRLYYKLGEYESALEVMDKARSLAPHLPEVDYYRSLVLVGLGKPAQALGILGQCTSCQGDARALNLLGHMAQETGDTQSAIRAFYRAAELKPEMEENYLDYSELCMNSENYVLALEILETGLAHIPHSYRLLIQKGAVLDKLTRRKEAEDVFRSAMKLQKDNRIAVLSLAIAQAHDHRLEEARQTLSGAIERFTKDAYMRYFYGSVLVQLAEAKGMKPEMAGPARRELERAIELNPAYADAYYQLAKTYLETEPAKAAEQLEACLRHKPNHYSAELQLARLYQKMGKQPEGDRLLSKAVRDKQAEKESEERFPRIEKVHP